MKKGGLIVLATLVFLTSFGQIKTPQLPTFQNHTIGATATDIEEQQMRMLEQKTGVYHKRRNLTEAQNQAAAVQFQMQYIQTQNGYKTYQNNQSEQAQANHYNKELIETLNEIRNNQSNFSATDYYNSSFFKNDLINFIKAKEIIRSMLSNETALSIKDAFYTYESTLGNLLLTYDEYNKTIQNNANFIKQWLNENHYNLADPEALQYGIQKFMNDTIIITVNGEKKGHLPFYYDYEDPKANDRANYFVTKTLATGGGQCHTLPITYLILAEQLGVETYLSYNPDHSFIRFKNNKGMLINYETTIGKFLPDAFYTETLPVMADAQRNKIFLTNLTKQQIVATTLFELANNFVDKHWFYDKKFIYECLSIGETFFPGNIFINNTHNYLHKLILIDEFNKKVQENNIQNMSQISGNPVVFQAYKNYHNYMTQITNLGIQSMPESEYLRFLKYYDEKEKLQKAKNIQNKTKHSLFFKN